MRAGPRLGRHRIPTGRLIVGAGIVGAVLMAARRDASFGDPALATEAIDAATGTGGFFEQPMDEEGGLGVLTEPIEDVRETDEPDAVVPAEPPPGLPAEATGAPQPAIATVSPASVRQALPNPRWVLFDRFGNPVEAMVEPWCRESDDCTQYGQIPFACVWVEYFGPDRVRIPYRLSDGDPNACYAPSGMDRNTWTSPPSWTNDLLPDAPYSLELVYWD